MRGRGGSTVAGLDNSTGGGSGKVVFGRVIWEGHAWVGLVCDGNEMEEVEEGKEGGKNRKRSRIRVVRNRKKHNGLVFMGTGTST